MGICTSNTTDVKDESKNQKLTQQEIEIIKTSWKLVVNIGLAKTGTNMMVRVFMEHRELKPLWRFSVNLETEEQMNSNQMLKAHGEKLFNAIDMAVNSLDDLETLVPILVQLGAGHYKYGVKEEHFGVIGGVLLETLNDVLREKFNPKVKRTWLKLFEIVSVQMCKGLQQAEQAKYSSKSNIEIHVNDHDTLLHTNGNSNKVFPNGCSYEN